MTQPLFSKENIKHYLLYGSFASILYTAAALVFIIHSRFANAWWLYVGNIAFMAVAGACIFTCHGMSAMRKVVTGNLVTMAGVLLSVVLLLILLLVIPDPRLINTPANLVQDKDNGLLWILFMNATIVNFSCGSFISLMTAYAVQRTGRTGEGDQPSLPSSIGTKENRS